MSSNPNLVPAVAGPPPLPDAAVMDNYTQTTGGGEEHPSPLKKAHQLLRGRYHWAVLLAVIFGVAGGVGGYFVVKPLYQSVGMVRINEDIGYIVTPKGQEQIGDFGAYVALEMSALKGDRNIERALASDDVRSFNLPLTNDVINQIKDELQVKSDRYGTIRISYEAADPAFAKAVVSSVIRSYMNIYGDRERQSRNQLMDTLESLRISQQADVTAANERLLAIAKQFGSADLAADFEMQQKEYYAIKASLREVETELAQRGVDLNNPQTLQPFDQMPVEELRQHDAVLNELMRVRTQFEDQLNVLRGMNYGPNHRTVRQVQEQLDQVDVRIAQRIRELQSRGGSVRPEAADAIGLAAIKLATVDELVRLKDALTRKAEEANAEMLKIGEKKMQLDNLREELEVAKRRLADTNVRIWQLKVEMNNFRDRVEVLGEGHLPSTPSNAGKRKQLAALGGMAGVSLGVFVMLLVGMTDPRLRTIDDARSGLSQVRMLGILPSLPEDLADPNQASIAAHCVHHIRAMLQIGVLPEQHRVYSITSPGAGTGKTSLTLALGLSFAAADSKVLLIDCDLVGGGLTRRIAAVVRRRIGHLLLRHGLVTQDQVEQALRLAQNRQTRLGEALIELGFLKAEDLNRVLNLQEQSLLGVMDACNGEPFDHCIAETGVRNLSILPTGTAMARHAAALSPAAVRRLVDQARQRFDIVLIDTGPILGSLEASIVAGTVDGTVLIVSRGDHRTVTNKSVEYLSSIRANLLGIVFNRADADDFERSSYQSLASMSSLRPDGELVEGEVIDGEASARLGPVGSAVASNSRIPRGGRGNGASTNGKRHGGLRS